jgi:uncharacterized protein with PIN domain
MPHQESNAREREHQLDLMYQDLVKIEQAITEAEQRESRINARTQEQTDDALKRFGNVIGKGSM